MIRYSGCAAARRNLRSYHWPLWALFLAWLPVLCWAQSPQSASTMSSAKHTEASAIAEIQQLHQFFEDWFRGTLEKTPAAFQRFEHVMAAEMSFIAPSGAPLSRAALVDFLWQSHGKNQNDALRIWTENETARVINDDVIVGVYEEHQELDGQHSVRRSSVFFQASDTAPNGWQWQHVHETWIATEDTKE